MGPVHQYNAITRAPFRELLTNWEAYVEPLLLDVVGRHRGFSAQ